MNTLLRIQKQFDECFRLEVCFDTIILSIGINKIKKVERRDNKRKCLLCIVSGGLHVSLPRGFYDSEDEPLQGDGGEEGVVVVQDNVGVCLRQWPKIRTLRVQCT